jgi:N-acetylglucosaminyldiphosphoundecaprenol N-acetyl-beta-D-mannosaminyltransferase
LRAPRVPLEHSNDIALQNSEGGGDGIASRYIVGMRVDATSYEQACRQILAWADHKESRYVCASTVNNAIESVDDPTFRAVMNGADMVTPDGMPLVWGLRLLGCREATRVYGPDLTEKLLALAAARGTRVGFYGGDPVVLATLTYVARRRWTGLRIVYTFSPPFRPLTTEEDGRTTGDIKTSGVQILFVGLGSPKQDRWMAEHKGSFDAVMVGVGAAFDFIAGTKRQAPPFMQRAGLEWLFRLLSEPRRLWKRYLVRNPWFVWLFGRELVNRQLHRRSEGGSG